MSSSGGHFKQVPFQPVLASLWENLWEKFVAVCAI